MGRVFLDVNYLFGLRSYIFALISEPNLDLYMEERDRQVSLHVPTEDEMRNTIRGFFHELPFQIEDIPEGDEERADFLINDGDNKVLLELKIKGEDCNEVKERREVLSAGEVYLRSESSLRRNRLSGLIRKGVSQLIKTPNDARFKILWLHAAGVYGENHEKRLVSTLFGRRFLIHTQKRLEDRWCYYFDNSDFFQHRANLTAAIVSFNGRCQLCINNLSPDYDAFRNSRFRLAFDDGYIDPAEFETRGAAYIVDGEIDRSNESAVRNYISNKYDCGTILDLDLKLHSAEIAMPHVQKSGT